MKTHTILFKSLFGLFFSLILFGCNSGKKPYEVATEPAQSIINEMGIDDYSIVLNDMDITEDDDFIYYKHKYVIIKPKDDQLDVDSTEWQNVSEEFFMNNENNLGMEIVSKHGHKFSTVPKPVGFDWAVGNEKYGEWEVDSTSTNTTNPERRWRYRNGSNFFLMYWMFSRRTPYSVYNNYATTARGKTPFYGSGNNTYGTKSNYNRAKRSSFYSRKSSSNSWGKTYSKRKASSSSRYRGGSSTRGRSGGHGK